MRHEKPWANLDKLPRSTRYYWRAKLDRVYTLCVWAGARKCKQADATIAPTLDAIWGMQGFYANVYLDRRTGEMRVAAESPGSEWESYGHMSSSHDTSDRLMSGINLTYLAVQNLLQRHMAPVQRAELLTLLPVVGKYQGDFWSSTSARAVASEAVTLRDINHAKVVAVAEVLNVEERVAQVMERKVIREAILLLEQKAPLLPDGVRV